MKLLSKLSDKLRGSQGEFSQLGSVKPASISEDAKSIEKPIEFLRALRMIEKTRDERSHSLKLYPGVFNEDLGRVRCQHCRARHCRGQEPRLVAVNYSNKGLELFGCDLCKGFLIRVRN